MIEVDTMLNVAAVRKLILRSALSLLLTVSFLTVSFAAVRVAFAGVAAFAAVAFFALLMAVFLFCRNGPFLPTRDIVP